MAIKAKRDTSKALREFWKPKGALHKRNASRLKTWLRKHGGNVDIATFIHSLSTGSRGANLARCRLKKALTLRTLASLVNSRCASAW